jgi:predicted metal-binding protein
VSASGVTIFVCVSCRGEADADSRPGAMLFDSLRARLDERGLDLDIRQVECLAVCKRPATIAFTATGKWTYVIGDLDADAHVDDLIAAAQSYAATENGIVPWKERPACLRKGVVSRTPPLEPN